MPLEAVTALLLPFLGTTLGAACVVFLRRAITRELNRGLSGFAAGVMVAASIWSLILPAIDQSAHWGIWSFVPALIGIGTGFLFLILLDQWLNRLENIPDNKDRNDMTMLAVTLHNLPEGMAVGVAIAGWLAETEGVSTPAMLTLSIGIALQNLPEGAIISMPMASTGKDKLRSFIMGLLSGVVEPAGAILTILLAEWVIPLLPFLLCFSAGAMLYVVVEELIPENARGEHSYTGTLCFCMGFVLMMTLDVVFG